MCRLVLYMNINCTFSPHDANIKISLGYFFTVPLFLYQGLRHTYTHTSLLFSHFCRRFLQFYTEWLMYFVHNLSSLP